MNNTITYQIILTPLSPFYFGSENRFREGTDADNDHASYIVKSNHFPQQTALLGMLRYVVLSNNNRAFSRKENRIMDPELARKLIGGNGFIVPDNRESVLDYGKIKSISPCYIKFGEKIIIPKPLDENLKVTIKEGKSLQHKINNIYPLFQVKKDQNQKGLFNEQFTDFKESVRIGIQTEAERTTNEENNYFKQTYYMFDSSTKSFVFEATIEDDLEIQPGIVSLGGDNSRFRLSIKKIGPSSISNNINMDEDERLYSKITLLSDAYIENEFLKFALFSISKTTPFRFLKTNINIKDYYQYGPNDKVKKSERFNLYKRGSVFYFGTEKESSEFQNHLAYKAFQQIGYNKYYETRNNKYNYDK